MVSMKKYGYHEISAKMDEPTAVKSDLYFINFCSHNVVNNCSSHLHRKKIRYREREIYIRGWTFFVELARRRQRIRE